MSSRPCSEERVINIQLGGCGLAKSSRKREEQRDLYIGTIMRQITPAVRTASLAGYARIFVMLGIKRKKKKKKETEQKGMQRGDTGGERNFVSTILVLRETRQPNTFSADQRVQEKMNEYLTK